MIRATETFEHLPWHNPRFKPKLPFVKTVLGQHLTPELLQLTGGLSFQPSFSVSAWNASCALGGTQPTLTLSGKGGEHLDYISGIPPLLLAKVLNLLDKLRNAFVVSFAQVLLFFRTEQRLICCFPYSFMVRTFVCVVGELNLVPAFGWGCSSMWIPVPWGMLWGQAVGYFGMRFFSVLLNSICLFVE